MYSKSLVSQFGKLVPVVVGGGVPPAGPNWSFPGVQKRAPVGYSQCQRRFVFRQFAPPDALALLAEVGISGRGGGPAKTQHLLEAGGSVHAHGGGFNCRRQQAPPNAALLSRVRHLVAEFTSSVQCATRASFPFSATRTHRR